MKKLFFTVLVFFIAFSLTQAQTGKGDWAVSVGPEVSFPTGDAADANELGTGFGGSARVEYGFSKKLVGFADVGYLIWAGDETSFGGGFGTSSTTVEWDWSAIVFMGGVKYYFSDAFYAMGQVGIHSFTFDMEVTGSGSSFFSGGSSSDSEFGFGAGAGYELALSKSLMLDLTAKYMLAASDFNYFGVRAGVKFGLN